jgi:hypothetical protein
MIFHDFPSLEDGIMKNLVFHFAKSGAGESPNKMEIYSAGKIIKLYKWFRFSTVMFDDTSE